MPFFDRFDICEAHLALEIDYNEGGVLRQRPSNMRRRESTEVQLARMRFVAGPFFDGFENLSENGQEIYRELEQRFGLRADRNADRNADRIDGYDRDDLGESPDY